MRPRTASASFRLWRDATTARCARRWCIIRSTAHSPCARKHGNWNFAPTRAVGARHGRGANQRGICRRFNSTTWLPTLARGQISRIGTPRWSNAWKNCWSDTSPTAAARRAPGRRTPPRWRFFEHRNLSNPFINFVAADVRRLILFRVKEVGASYSENGIGRKRSPSPRGSTRSSRNFRALWCGIASWGLTNICGERVSSYD